jgi:hypothetical protein
MSVIDIRRFREEGVSANVALELALQLRVQTSVRRRAVLTDDAFSSFSYVSPSKCRYGVWKQTTAACPHIVSVKSELLYASLNEYCVQFRNRSVRVV